MSDKKKAAILKDNTIPPSTSEKSKKYLRDFLTNFKIHKSPGKKEPVKANPKILLTIFAIICVALIILSSLFDSVAKPLKAAASVIVVPAQSGINVVGAWLSDKLLIFNSMADLSEENEELRRQIDELRATNNQLRQENEKLERLENLLDLKNEYSDYDTIAAEVISKDSSKWFSTFTINKGTDDGVVKNMNVVAQGGLVGVVSDAGKNYATVRTVINDDSNISAMFGYSTDLCIVTGNLTSMESNIIDFSSASITAQIEEGMTVVTSSVSSIYLPGLLIGYVTDSQVDGNELTQSGHLTPVVDFENLSEVLVINKLKETSD